MLCRNHSFVAERRGKITSHAVAGYPDIGSRPKGTVETMCFSNVLSGHGSNTAMPATLWLANPEVASRLENFLHDTEAAALPRADRNYPLEHLNLLNRWRNLSQHKDSP